jgi:hypothetical protein
MSDTQHDKRIQSELVKWKRKMNRNPSFTGQLAKKAQAKINGLIPEKIHEGITVAIKQMVRGVLFGAQYTAPAINASISFREREKLVQDRIDFYKNTAAAEGGITGFGGLLLGLADFPILLGLKLKLLFDIASMYGYDTKQFSERLYILYIFQLAFSSQEHRRMVFAEMENWKDKTAELPKDIHEFDWRKFQQEYRDHIDLAKLGQLIPVVGAVVGLVVNYRLIVKLGETAMNAYRMRRFAEATAVLNA